MREDVYWNLENVFDAEWRKTDSTFAMVTPEEVEAARRRFQPIIEDEGKRREYVERYKDLLQRYGHTAAIIATK